MRDGLRKLLPVSISLALVASLGATPVAAQDEVTPAAGINADRVDGKHAINSTGNKNQRKGKLMAFSASGYLPDNVIKKAVDADKLDGLDSTAFASLAALQALQSPAGAVNEADNPLHWNQLQGVPATLADGNDDGLTKITFIRSFSDFSAAGLSSTFYDKSCPSGKAVSGGFWTNFPDDIEFYGSLPLSDTQWRVWAKNSNAAARNISVWVECIATEPATVIAKLAPSAKKAIKTSTKGAGTRSRK